MELEERIISLETKIAYLENYIAEINQAVLGHDKHIKLLNEETEYIKKEIRDKRDKLPDDEKPPHY